MRLLVCLRALVFFGCLTLFPTNSISQVSIARSEQSLDKPRQLNACNSTFEAEHTIFAGTPVQQEFLCSTNHSGEDLDIVYTLEFDGPAWMTIQPASATVPPYTSLQFVAIYHTDLLPEGTYTGTITVNDGWEWGDSGGKVLAIMLTVNRDPNACAPPNPSFVYADNTNGKGLFECETVSAVNVGDQTQVVFKVRPTQIIPDITGKRGIGFWFAVSATAADGQSASVEPDYSDPVGGSMANLGLIRPDSYATYVARFCKSGDIGVRVELSLKSVLAGLLEYITDELVNAKTSLEIIEVADQIAAVPLIFSGGTHFIQGFQQTSFKAAKRELTAGVKDFLALAKKKNRQQIGDLISIFVSHGWELTTDVLGKWLFQRSWDIFSFCTDIWTYNVTALADGTPIDVRVKAP